jgi:hypothetical protein
VAFSPLTDRIAASPPQIPLVIAGPILRRVDGDEVTVWVALRAARSVTLTVSETTGATATEVMAGNRATVAIGDNLHVVAVTAIPPSPLQGLLPGTVYAYDLDFEDELGQVESLTTPNTVVLGTGATVDLTDVLSYAPYELPTFALAPSSLNDIRLVHASCRKLHESEPDAFEVVDRLIEVASEAGTAADFARTRPHLLLLTGDQIYADDVADSLLAMLIDAAHFLLGWHEELPVEDLGFPHRNRDFKPGERAALVQKDAKFTTEKEGKSHLLGLGEFYAMYLFAWCDALWPTSLPGDLPAVGDGHERGALTSSHAVLGRVRRSLANTPTCMIFDDHEVTDDWYINRQWCSDGVPADKIGGAVATKLGQRVIQNALLAYAIFQAWGNTPEQFAAAGSAGAPGRDLLSAAAVWSQARGDDDFPITQPGPFATGKLAREMIARRVGMPTALKSNETRLKRPAGDPLAWHYRVAPTGSPLEIIVLDTRTMRSYPTEKPTTLGAGLLDPDADSTTPSALATQLDAWPVPTGDGLTVVVSAGPLILPPTLERAVRLAPLGNHRDLAFTLDAEAWGGNRRAFAALIGRLASRRDRTVVLSGDVHWGFGAILDVWGEKLFGRQPRAPAAAAVIVQLASSAARNKTGLSIPLHEEGVTIALSVDPSFQFPGPRTMRALLGIEPHAEYIVWNTQLNPGEVPITWGAIPENLAFEFRGGRAELGSVPAVLPLPVPTATVVTKRRDWQYRIRWLTGTKSLNRQPVPAKRIDLLPPGSGATLRITTFGGDLKTDILDQSGRHFVGHNNVGVVTFYWPTATSTSTPREVKQELSWRETRDGPFVTTTFTAALAPAPDPAPAVP